jgi:hypothetical protein
MKNTISIFLIGILFSISACITVKTYTDEEKKMKIGDKVFIIKKDGEKISGEKISYPPAFGFSKWLKIDGQKIQDSNISAYQDKHGYHIKFGNPFNWVWVIQLKRGKINLFHFESLRQRFADAANPSHFETEEHFVFQKDGGQLYESSIGKLAEFLQDKPEAYNKFISQFGGKDLIFFSKELIKHPKVLFEVIDIYNGN